MPGSLMRDMSDLSTWRSSGRRSTHGLRGSAPDGAEPRAGTVEASPREPQDPSPVIRLKRWDRDDLRPVRAGDTLSGGGSLGLERRAATTTFQVSAAPA